MYSNQAESYSEGFTWLTGDKQFDEDFPTLEVFSLYVVAAVKQLSKNDRAGINWNGIKLIKYGFESKTGPYDTACQIVDNGWHVV